MIPIDVKGTVDIFLSDPPNKEKHVRFTMVPLNCNELGIYRRSSILK